MSLFVEVLKWFAPKMRAACVLKMSQQWIESHFDELDLDINDVFFQRTWSLDFLERVLQPEHSDLWDHVSIWYTLPESFCERNIDWLNFHDLVYNQNLSRAFYLRHQSRFDWLPEINREQMFQQFYQSVPKNNRHPVIPEALDPDCQVLDEPQ